MIGTGLSEMKPGSVEGLQLTVTDMDAARDELAYFRDPDGNGWALQEIRD